MKGKEILLILLLISLMNCSKENNFSYIEIPSGIEIKTRGIKKRIIFYNDSSVRISALPIDKEFKDFSLVVNRQPENVDFEIIDNKSFNLKSKNLIVKIDKNNGSISFIDLEKNQFLQEHPNQFANIKEVELLDSTYFQVKQTFQLSENEGIYGLGQFQNGFMNYRNKNLLLVQANKIAIVPFLISTANYGILWDNYSKTKFHDSKDGMWFSSSYADQLDYYFVSGKNMDEVISGYRFLSD